MGVLAGALGLLWRLKSIYGDERSHRSLVGNADPVSDYFTFSVVRPQLLVAAVV